MISDRRSRIVASLDRMFGFLPRRWSPSALLDWLSLDGRLRVRQPLLLALGPLIVLLALFVSYRWIYVVAYSYGLLALACYAWIRYQAPRIHVVRHLQDDWAQVGDSLTEQWTLTNYSWLPLLWLELDDASELPGYAARRVAASGPQANERWLTSAVCTRRGVYSLGPLDLRMGDPFGIFEYRWRDPDTRRIIIYPPLVRLPPLSVPQGQRGGLQRADILQQFATPSVGGLREYRPGDMPSHIHWPTVARKGELMVKEFDQERAGAVWIVLDLYRPLYHYNTNGISQTLEQEVVLAASLAAQLLGEGRSVGLLADDGRGRMLAPSQGPRQLWSILSELVGVDATGDRSLEDVLRRWRQSREQGSARSAALVLVTPDLSSGWLSALVEAAPRGGALALLVSDAQDDAAQQTNGSMTRLQAGLATLGVATHMIRSDADLPRINPPRPRDEIRTTPLGRAVRIRRTDDSATRNGHTKD